MTDVMVVIAAPQSDALTGSAALALSGAVAATAMTWLADGEAVEFLLPEGASRPDMLAAARAQANGSPFDIAIVPAAARRKKVLIADMDSTMIRQECIDELAAEAGLKDEVSSITARAMNGELDFEDALRARVKLLEGLPATVIDRVLSTRIELMPGGIELVRTMRRAGAWCALVSGGFTDFTARIAEMVGFQEHQANSLERAGGKLTGTVAEPILGRQAKVAALEAIVERLGVDMAETIAVGDGANDLGMLGRAGMGVALHAKPVVAGQADIRIDHGDLTSLLYLQGYRRDEFAA